MEYLQYLHLSHESNESSDSEPEVEVPEQLIQSLEINTSLPKQQQLHVERATQSLHSMHAGAGIVTPNASPWAENPATPKRGKPNRESKTGIPSHDTKPKSKQQKKKDLDRDGVDIDCGKLDKTGERIHKRAVEFFGKKVEIYSLQENGSVELFRATTIAKHFKCKNNTLGMMLARRRRRIPGIYQARSINLKPPGSNGLKVGGYFVTLEAAQRLFVEFKAKKGRGSSHLSTDGDGADGDDSNTESELPTKSRTRSNSFSDRSSIIDCSTDDTEPVNANATRTSAPSLPQPTSQGSAKVDAPEATPQAASQAVSVNPWLLSPQYGIYSSLLPTAGQQLPVSAYQTALATLLGLPFYNPTLQMSFLTPFSLLEYTIASSVPSATNASVAPQPFRNKSSPSQPRRPRPKNPRSSVSRRSSYSHLPNHPMFHEPDGLGIFPERAENCRNVNGSPIASSIAVPPSF